MPPANIYVIGAQCTGKTTLVNALKRHFDQKAYGQEATESAEGLDTSSGIPAPEVLQETARTVFLQHKFNSDVFHKSPSETLRAQELIMEAQYTAEKKLFETESWYISDRSVIDPTVYASQYVGQNEATRLRSSPKFVEMERRMAESLVVVCQGEFDRFKDDQVRLSPKSRSEWEETQTLFIRYLVEWGPIVWDCSIHDNAEFQSQAESRIPWANTLVLSSASFMDTGKRVKNVVHHWEHLSGYADPGEKAARCGTPLL